MEWRSIVLQAHTEDGAFSLIGKPNARGFLGQVIAESIPATDAQDARTKVYRALASSLSNIAIQLDMPISVYQSDMIELATGNRFISIVSPHLERPMEIASTATMSKEFRSLAALYREALNSDTPAFQFLCYFKILEGIREESQQLIAEARTVGKEISKPPAQVVPSEDAQFVPWLNAVYGVGRPWDFIMLQSMFVPEARGKKFNQIIDDCLRPVRDRVAHAILDSGELTLSADEDLDVRELYKWLSLMKCIVRHMLKSDFQNSCRISTRRASTFQPGVPPASTGRVMQLASQKKFRIAANSCSKINGRCIAEPRSCCRLAGRSPRRSDHSSSFFWRALARTADHRDECSWG